MADHTTDTDCTLDANDSCVECSTYHGDPCPDCGGRGYHAGECRLVSPPIIAEESPAANWERRADAASRAWDLSHPIQIGEF